LKQQNDIKLGRLKAMYILTIASAGSFGLGILYMPELITSFFGWPVQDPIVFGISGSVYLAFAITALFGLKQPLRFAPVLLLQLIYKVLWISAAALPLMFENQFPGYGFLHFTIFSLFIAGDLIAIPFSNLFESNSEGLTAEPEKKPGSFSGIF